MLGWRQGVQDKEKTYRKAKKPCTADGAVGAYLQKAEATGAKRAFATLSRTLGR